MNVQTVDYTETGEGIEMRGVIAVHTHGSPASETWYNEIAIWEAR